MMFSKEGDDPSYEHLRSPTDAHCVRCRDNLLTLWNRSAPYLDANLEDRARRALHSVYWEMQLTAALLDAGASLVQRERRVPRNEGPDVLSERPASWFEAVAIEAGIGADAVPVHEGPDAYSVPDDQIILRITNALLVKRDKRDTYVSRGWLASSDRYVIAVNAGAVPNGKSELPLPRIVRTVFPLGHYAVPVDVRSGEFGEGYYRHSASITKSGGASVGTALFENPKYSGVSAVVYSTADAFNPPPAGQSGVIMVHNPMASSPFPRGALRGIREYWRENDELRWSV